MLRAIAAPLLLGLAGIDPTAALLAVAALVAGAKGRAITTFGVTVLLGIPVFGTPLTYAVGVRVARLDRWLFVFEGRAGAIVGLIIGGLLLGAGMVSVLRPKTATTLPKERRISAPAMGGAGALYVVSLLIDPTFLALVVLAGRSADPVHVVLMQIVWTLLSQAPLIVLLLAVRRVGPQRAVDQFQSWWRRVRPLLRTAATVAMFVSGALLVVDGGWWFATGHFLIFDPAR